MAFIPTGCCPNITVAAGKRGEVVDSPGDQVCSTSPLIFPQQEVLLFHLSQLLAIVTLSLVKYLAFNKVFLLMDGSVLLRVKL